MARFHSELIRASRMHRRACRQEFQVMDLSDGQPKVLAVLLHHEGVLQKDLAKLCGVEPATMTSLLKKLTASRLIMRESVYVSGGKRAYGIYLTDEGRAKARNIEDIVNTLEEAGFRGFTDSEKEQVISYLGRISDNLKSYADSKEPGRF